jgi:hypothetical protein
MTIGQARQHIFQIGERLDVVEPRRRDQRDDDGPALGAAIRSGEEMVLAAEGNLPFILPISGKKSRSITVGIHSTGAVFGSKAVSSAPVAELSTLRRRRV